MARSVGKRLVPNGPDPCGRPGARSPVPQPLPATPAWPPSLPHLVQASRCKPVRHLAALLLALLHARVWEPLHARRQGAENGTTLHQNSRIPGAGDYLPKEAARWNRNVISPGHSRKPERPARVCYQPSKLVMRVRFPSAARVHQQFSIRCSHGFLSGRQTAPVRLSTPEFPRSVGNRRTELC